MGDRCYWVANVHRDDKTQFVEIFDWLSEEDGVFTDEEANHANFTEMEKAAKAGLRFHGSHSAGDSYGCFAFCSWEGELHTFERGHDCGDGYVITFDGPDPVESSIEGARQFVTKLKLCIDDILSASREDS